MGSGLILLLIVGAWLAVLVPMALRSHEASSALATVDKFSDAMRVLSRRGGAARARGGPALQAEDGRAAQAEGGAAPGASGRPLAYDPVPGSDPLPGSDALSGSDALPGPDPLSASVWAPASAAVPASEPVPEPRSLRRRSADALDLRRQRRRARRADRPALTPAARRLRALLVLVALAVVTLVGAVVGSWWLLLPHLVTDVLLLGFLCWLRSQAVAKEEREWRRAMGDPLPAPVSTSSRPVAPPAARTAARVAGIPDRMPSRTRLAAAAHRLTAVPAARVEDVPQVRGAQGEPWQPVPVPAPTYVSAPAAPRRVIDLTRSGAGAMVSGAERRLATDEAAPELEHILDRRAVGD